MNTIKILNISTSKMKQNGITSFLLNYYNNIDKAKIQMDYVAPNKVSENLKKKLTLSGNKIYEIDELKGKKLKQKNPIKYCYRIYRILKEEKYDIVHIHGSSSMMCLELIMAKLAGCKIRIVHSHNTKSDFNKIDVILRPIFNKLYTHAFACGEEAGKWLYKDKEFITINNGQDIDKFKFDKKIRNMIRTKYNLDDKIVIGHVGAFNFQKNHEFLIEIFRELCKNNNDKYCLLLIGDGDLRKNIENRVREYKIENNVIFVGITDEVNKLIQAADMMLLPSRFEGFPNVLVEWQISGLPCIVSDKVTKKVKLTELVQFAPIDCNPEIWVDKIKRIKIQDREDNNQAIINKIREEGYDIKENAKNLEKIYFKIMEGKSK